MFAPSRIEWTETTWNPVTGCNKISPGCDECVRTDTPFFFKQWGGVFKKKTGRILDGQIWDQMPERTG